MELKLNCSSFEELMIAKDSHSYPCDIWVRMGFTGRLDRSLFEESWKETLRLHPLFICHLEKRATGHRWVKSSKSPTIEWISTPNNGSQSSPNTTDWPAPKPFGLYDGRLVFPYVLDKGNGSHELILQIHHAVCDGLGLLDVLEDLWTIYHRMVTGTDHKRLDRFQSIQNDLRLKTRNQFGLNGLKIFKLIPKQLVGLAGVRQFLMRSPQPLVAHKLPTDFPSQVTHIERKIESSLFQSIRMFAQQQKCTVNECLAAAIFDAVSAFRNERKEETQSDWIRMMIPMDMRTSEDKKNLSACNVVSSIFLDRQPSQISHFDDLIRGLNKEMNLIKSNKLAFMFLLSIWFRKIFHFGRHGSALAKRCETSIVFTNLGRIFPRTKLPKTVNGIECGNLELNEFSILAPLNPFTVAAVSFCEFGSTPKLQLRYCDRVLSPGDACNLMEKILGRLKNF